MISQKQAKRLTSSIIKAMEEPSNWKQPRASNIGLQQNAITGRAYTMSNALVLSMISNNDQLSPYWLTFNQVNQKNAQFKKGIKRVPVHFWSIKEKETEEEVEEENQSKSFILRIYQVCNIEHTTLSDTKERKEKIEKAKEEQEKEIHRPEFLVPFFEKEKIKIVNGGDSAYYNPIDDTIGIPSLSCFKSEDDYIHTLSHECVHATGHTKRLKRFNSLSTPRFASQEYSKEELVAEIGAKIISDMHGIKTSQCFDYLAGRAKKIKTENLEKDLFFAISKASKAVEYIMKA